jgi:hypothetical protein
MIGVSATNNDCPAGVPHPMIIMIILLEVNRSQVLAGTLHLLWWLNQRCKVPATMFTYRY